MYRMGPVSLGLFGLSGEQKSAARRSGGGGRGDLLYPLEGYYFSTTVKQFLLSIYSMPLPLFLKQLAKA